MYKLKIPDDVYTWAQQVAQQGTQSVDDVLMTYIKLVSETLPVLPVGEEAELAALRYLSDDALWTMAREVMPDNIQQQMQTLMDKNSNGTISDEEYQTLEALVERGQQLTLRKSEAMAILTERGHKVSLKSPSSSE